MADGEQECKMCSAQVKHLTFNIRSETHKAINSGRKKEFYDDKLLIIELFGNDSEDCATCSMKTICTLGEFKKGEEVPVQMCEKVPEGQYVQMKVYIAEELQDTSLHIYASNSITLSNSGIISCQLSANGIICNVHFSIELSAQKESKNIAPAPVRLSPEATNIKKIEDLQMLPARRLVIVALMGVLFSILIRLANNVILAAERPPEKSSRNSALPMLKLNPGEVLQAGDHLSGCFSLNDWSDCQPSVLTLKRNGQLALYFGISKDDLDSNMKHCYSDSSGNVLLDGRRDGIWQGVATGIKHSIHKIKSIFSPKNKSNSPILRPSGPAKIPSCIEPVWHSGSFPRWKQLLQLRFGKYHCHLDSFGYLRIFKGRKELWSELIGPASLIFPLVPVLEQPSHSRNPTQTREK